MGELSPAGLVALAAALRSGSLRPPYGRTALLRFVSAEAAEQVCEALPRLGGDPLAAATALDALAAEREAAGKERGRTEFVWSGPSPQGVSARHTAVVVRELFRRAKQRVTVASFALDKPRNTRAIFAPLAENLDANPALAVRLFLHVGPRDRDDVRPPQQILIDFAQRFRHDLWPGERLPDVFHDPRGLDITGSTRASLHAKVVLADSRHALVTSANFTEAAHERNVEAGLLLHDSSAAARIEGHFLRLADRRALRRLAL